MTDDKNPGRSRRLRLLANWTPIDWVPDLFPANNPDELLRIICTGRPFTCEMHRARLMHCWLCGCTVYAGDTIFVNHGPPADGLLLCYGCGIGIEVYLGRMTDEQALDLPAHGGPHISTPDT